MRELTPAFGQADLTTCDREPIHLAGSIQPHGVLLALDPRTLAVLQIAGDTVRILGVAPDRLVETGIVALLPPASLDQLRRLLSQPPSPPPKPTFAFEACLFGRSVNVTAHENDGVLILELEPYQEGHHQDALLLVHGMISRSQSTTGVAALCDVVAETIRSATGFDRVMTYRFAPDGSGAVIAEAKRRDLVSYLGLHYPASDIPQQARDLYLRNRIRLIPDARYEPVPLGPVDNPLTGRPLDMSYCSLRSVSPLHLEYLGNMGVRASMSISIVIGGHLWGLIACHHETPHFVAPRLRAACELLAQFVSLQLESRIIADGSAARLRSRGTLDKLTAAMSSDDDLATCLMRHRPNLLDLISAEGVAICFDGQVSTLGHCPPPRAIADVVGWLNDTVRQGLFSTDQLPALHPPAAAFADTGAGLLALSISRQPKDYVLWFRPELVRTVRWAGDPNKPVDPADGRLHPRASFAAWQETVRLRALPWGEVERETAEAFRVALLEVILRRLDQLNREREAAKARQDMLMVELDHRVKNSLATIQSLFRLTAKTATDLAGFQNGFEGRLRSIANVHNLLSVNRWEGISLRRLLTDELASQQVVGSATLDGPELTLTPKAGLALALAFHELTINALRFGALAAPAGRVRISWCSETADGRRWIRLDWCETGGPAAAPPAQSGFDRLLLEHSLAHDVDGRVDLRLPPTGLTCTIRLPFDQFTPVAVTPIAVTPGPIGPSEPKAVGDRRVLVVEDQALIAFDLLNIIEEAGMSVLGPLATLKAAVQAATTEPIDAALLDVDLGGEYVWAAAEILRDRGVPFAFTTGFVATMIPDHLRAAPILSKPYRSKDILTLLDRLLAKRKQ